MSDQSFKGDRHMHRDKLKLILFDWLKEKGILGELQAFLRMKMVEKLQQTQLASASKQAQFSAKDNAINIMVYEYLKHHNMFYTSSVFASECSSIQQTSLDSVTAWEDILKILGLSNCDNMTPNSSRDEKACLLNHVLDGLGIMHNKKHESKSCQCNIGSNTRKLLLNAQSQTSDAAQKTTNTQLIQTVPCVRHAETQTEDCFTTVQRMSVDVSDEMLELQKKLAKSQSALELCQLKLQHSEDKIEYLTTNKNEYIAEEDITSLKLAPAHQNKRNRTVCHKRIQEACRFLNHLDGRLEFLDRKYQKVTRQTPDQNSLALT
ncbi:putative Uncoordinated [Daphnia magna]|uniref:Putative Uncoordinated n=1 Tax=Daphnia magna TaxID=35525 RepID=A0A162PQ61_9CRUS|nr:putative Uncoordinated [Daphnia magna]